MSKPRALTRLRTVQKRLASAEDKATELADERNHAMAAAAAHGATYRELQEASGLSHARVAQVLRRARQAPQ